jgi:hypothetical protein
MTEGKALVLTIGGMLSLYLGVYLVLASIDASMQAQGLAYFLMLCASSYAASSVVMHYGSSKRRKR